MLRWLFGIVSCLMLASFAKSPILIDPSSSAGIVEREVEKEFESVSIGPYREIPLIELEMPQEQLNLPEGKTTVCIQKLCFEGNSVFSSCYLEEKLSILINRELCMQDIKSICLAIQELYVRKGYFLARAYPPPQRIDNNTLTICILEGILGDIQISGNCHYPCDYIFGYFKSLVGRPIQYDRLLKALFLLNENSDLEARGIFVKGKQTGCADLILDICDALPIHFYANTNNYGPWRNSRWRTGGRLDYGNFLLPGDLLSVTGVIGYPLRSLQFADFNYCIPVNKQGGFLSAGYLYSNSKVLQFYDPLRLKGRAQIASLEYRQALQRRKAFSTDFYTAFQYKQIYNFALYKLSSKDKLRILSAGICFDGVDRFCGRNVGDLRFSGGIPDFLNGSRAVDVQSSRPGAGGRFFIWNAEFRRIQPIWNDQFILFNFFGQVSTNKLPLPEQFYIGGADTVRGYPMAAALGDDGYVFSLEYRTPPFFLANKVIPFINRTMGDFLQLVAFIDTGGVYLRHGKVENQNEFVSLTGIGIGIRVYAPYGLDISCDVGFPLTREKRTSSAMTYFRLTWCPF